MKKLIFTIVITLVGLSPVNGQNIFTIIDPDSASYRWGKSPYDGGPYSYVDEDEIIYHFNDTLLLEFEDHVDGAFDTWSNVGFIEFVRDEYGGVQIVAEDLYSTDRIAKTAPEGPLYKPGTTAFETSNFIMAINSGDYTWSETDQNLFNPPYLLHPGSIVLHEAGHILGLAHPDTLSYTHNASAPVMAGSDNEYFHTHTLTYLREQDILGAQFLQFMVPGYYTDLQTALNAAENYGATVYLYEDYTAGSDLIVPSNAVLELHKGITLTISNGNKLIVSGVAKFGDGTFVELGGNLEIQAGSELNFGSDVTLTFTDTEESTFLIAGSATLGDNFTMAAASKLEVAQTGRLEFTGDAELEFDERVMTFPGFPPIYGPGFFTIHGEVVSSHSSGETITMNVAPGTTMGYWNGITVYNSASGELRDIEIEDASIGVTASSASTIGLRDITVTAPTTTGFDFNSSDVQSINLFVTGSDGTGMEISGGAPEFTYFEVTGSDQSGLVVSSYADAYTEEGHVSGSGGGGSNAGVWTDNATYTHINGEVGPNSGWDAAAVNSATVLFNGTSWSGTPYTYADGSSTLTIQNQNNPVKAIAQQAASEEHLLLKEWSQRRREDPDGAAGWLKDTQPSLSVKLQGVAAILLADYQLARGNSPRARSVLEDLSPEVKSAQSPGALARRTLQVALNGAPDRELAIQSLNELEQSGLKPALLEHYRHMAYQRYGYDMDREAVSPKEPIAGATAEEMEISNYPNPFNPVTNIEYTLPVRMKVSLAVYDLLGREVAVLVNREQAAGSYDIPFDATYLSSGIYIYRLEAGSHILTGRMTLIK